MRPRFKLCRWLKGLAPTWLMFLGYRPCRAWSSARRTFQVRIAIGACLRVVRASLSGCCSGRVSGSVLNPSCNVRYAVYPFYNLTAVATPAPPPPVVTSSGSVIIPKGKCQKSWLIIVAIVVSNNPVQEANVGIDITTIKSLQYDLNSIEAATNKFADGNKLGEGGFGVVYKGSFLNGKEIAVKRLSKRSGQGAKNSRMKL
ncbi:hypothetical protein SLEP1_g49235 [Rubroshorea leprosula]|uniref:Protein kinase domain-containing protein n=1 Tax=Rubroshorea leprosula TaxID=152421 RepID=A0AAV5LW85_9ROSI|nr:hypothetical protein SLEP1_g49235 [Rubroshorea leprosula]